jgi:uncharacterized membrane protein YhhN
MNMVYGAAVLFGLAYGIFLEREQSLTRAVAKTLPLALLAIAAWLMDAPWLLVAGFALSALGDWCLAFAGEKFFLAGLILFLVAHLAYARLFFLGQDPVWSAGPTFLAGAVIVFAIALGVFRRLRDRLGAMKWPVAVYTAIIAVMAVSALARGPDPVLLAGVVLFMASDSALAFETFPPTEGAKTPRWRSWFIWYAYFIGQALIGAAYLLR